MTELQKQKLTHFFNVLDHNGNGVLESEDFDQIGEHISDIIGHNENSVERLDLKLRAHRLFVQILKDLEKSEAELSLEEWLTFFSNMVLVKPNDYINQSATYLFSLFDQDMDGHIDEKEYLDMFKAYGLYVSVSKKAFDLLDFNGDGRISGGELVKAFEDFFLSSEVDAPGNWIFGDWRMG
ncbi:EF-hand domain-containing protein [Ekhidna sp.]|uniref:EF-hand domain-containing protein n=1 Tax=Ekhidna sp. TaxID=2608089 RepID=UPI003B510C03